MHHDDYMDREEDRAAASLRNDTMTVARFLGYEAIEDLLDGTIALFIGGDLVIEGNLFAVASFVSGVSSYAAWRAPVALFEAA